jgi:hypothetical protein
MGRWIKPTDSISDQGFLCFIGSSRPSQLASRRSLGNNKGHGNNYKYVELHHPRRIAATTLHLSISNIHDITEASVLDRLPLPDNSEPSCRQK